MSIQYSKVNQITPTVSTSAYSTGQSVGGLLTLTGVARSSGWGGVIQSVVAVITSGAVPTLDLLLFNANPTGSTLTNQSTVSIAAADVTKIMGIVHLTDTTVNTGASVVQNVTTLTRYTFLTGNTLYAVLITRSAYTPTTTTDLTLTVVAGIN